MNPRIEHLQEKKLIGLSTHMSIVKNLTGQLWGQFGPRIKEIKNRVSEDKISLQVYPASYFEAFDPTKEFEKWATVEVADFNAIPTGLASLTLNEGSYAVFDYKGSSSDKSIFQYIYSEWVPNSEFVLDNRPHFEVLGAGYKNNDPESEEEIWVPIREN